jgi:hypothetical protein
MDLECILVRLDEAYERKLAPITALEGEWHFAAQIKLARDKAEEYYAKLNESAAYRHIIVPDASAHSKVFRVIGTFRRYRTRQCRLTRVGRKNPVPTMLY